MSLRRLCNVALTVLQDGVPREHRTELVTRLNAAAAASEPAPEVELSATEKAHANKAAMSTLLGMLPGGRPRTA